MNAHGIIGWRNAAFARFAGSERAPNGCHFLHDFLDIAATEPDSLARLRGAVDSGNGCRAIVAAVDADGARAWMDVTMEPVRAGSRSAGYLAVLTNVTNQVELTRTLDLARLKAEQANAAKTEWLAHVSHEIRTPLSAILGYVDLLRDEGEGRLTNEQDHAVRTIGSAGEHLMHVLNGVLDLSKMEVGQLVITEEAVNLPLLLLEIESLMRGKAHQKRLTLRVRLESAIPATVYTDATRVRQILTNLIGNAITFTDVGEVAIVVSYRDERTGSQLVVRVTDTGIGMGDDEASGIFDPYRQGQNRGRGGTGLGLTISRRIAEHLGGTLQLVHSAPHKGSCFEVCLPMRRCAESSMCPELIPPVPLDASTSGQVVLRGHVLLVEDSADNQRLLATLLRRAGALVTVASNGREALHMLEDVESRPPVDLILSDYEMPEMDGPTLVHTLRQCGCHIPVVALTAHTQPEDRDRCLAAGFDEFVTKPVRHHSLLALCARWLSAAREVPVDDGTIPTTAISLPPMRALADDPALSSVVEGYALALPARVRALAVALEQRPANEARRLAHQLHGAAGSYGFPEIGRVAHLMECALRDVLHECGPLLDDLGQLADAAEAAVRETPWQVRVKPAPLTEVTAP